MRYDLTRFCGLTRHMPRIHWACVSAGPNNDNDKQFGFSVMHRLLARCCESIRSSSLSASSSALSLPRDLSSGGGTLNLLPRVHSGHHRDGTWHSGCKARNDICYSLPRSRPWKASVLLLTNPTKEQRMPLNLALRRGMHKLDMHPLKICDLRFTQGDPRSMLDDWKLRQCRRPQRSPSDASAFSS